MSQTRENIIASIVDFASIIFAYKIGVSQLGLVAGLGYGVFDAWLVVWQRERISNGFKYLADRLEVRIPFRRKDTLPWAQD